MPNHYLTLAAWARATANLVTIISRHSQPHVSRNTAPEQHRSYIPFGIKIRSRQFTKNLSVQVPYPKCEQFP